MKPRVEASPPAPPVVARAPQGAGAGAGALRGTTGPGADRADPTARGGAGATSRRGACALCGGLLALRARRLCHACHRKLGPELRQAFPAAPRPPRAPRRPDPLDTFVEAAARRVALRRAA